MKHYDFFLFLKWSDIMHIIMKIGKTPIRNHLGNKGYQSRTQHPGSQRTVDKKVNLEPLKFSPYHNESTIKTSNECSPEMDQNLENDQFIHSFIIMKKI
jgi:hypothetical protein